MNEESKRIVEALRHVGYGLAQGDTNCSKCPMQEIPIGELECGSDCPTTMMNLAADLIEKLSAQLVNQATEYSRALKITTEQRDMLLGTQDKLAALLSYVTGGRFSKTSYSIDEMERLVDDYQQSECAKCDEFEQVKAERDRYWQYIRGMGCDTCGGDCERCEVTPDGAWSGWTWNGAKMDAGDNANAQPD